MGLNISTLPIFHIGFPSVTHVVWAAATARFKASFRIHTRICGLNLPSYLASKWSSPPFPSFSLLPSGLSHLWSSMEIVPDHHRLINIRHSAQMNDPADESSGEARRIFCFHIGLWLGWLTWCNPNRNVDCFHTLIMLYKGQSIRDAGQNNENNKGQGLDLSHIARGKKAWSWLGLGKGR